MKIECIEPSPWEGLEFGDIHTVVDTFHIDWCGEMITMYKLAELPRQAWDGGWWSKRFKPLNRKSKIKVADELTAV